jgi:hypothetical protein
VLQLVPLPVLLQQVLPLVLRLLQVLLLPHHKPFR